MSSLGAPVFSTELFCTHMYAFNPIMLSATISQHHTKVLIQSNDHVS